MNYQTVEWEVANDIGTVRLNRPEIRNAMNEIVISEAIEQAICSKSIFWLEQRVFRADQSRG